MLGGILNPSSATQSTRPSLLGFPNPRTNLKISNIRSSSSPPNLPLASRIFVRNLSYSTSETNLKKEFSNFGHVVEVKLAKDEDTARPKGYAFVQFSSQDDAMLAIEQMDRKYIDGRVVYVEIAKPVSNPLAAYPRTSGPPSKQDS